MRCRGALGVRLIRAWAGGATETCGFSGLLMSETTFYAHAGPSENHPCSRPGSAKTGFGFQLDRTRKQNVVLQVNVDVQVRFQFLESAV